MISPVKYKYRTNLFILKKDVVRKIKEQFDNLYEQYVPIAAETFNKYLPKLKECDIFKFDVPDNRYAWFFADNIEDFDHEELLEEDYPQILSCGSKAFIFAEEASGSP